MSHFDQVFDLRLRRLARKHRRMYDNGVVARLGPDGLVSAYPRRRMPRFPLKSVLILLGVAFVFKAWMLAAMGTAAYGERVEAMASGNLAEQGAAWVLQADPATVWLAGMIGGLRG